MMSVGVSRVTSTVLEPTRQGAHVVEMQRRRLLLAMVEVLAEHGLEEARVGRVCKRAGVSRRTFYDLFADREACFLAAFELALERIAEESVPLFACEGRWRERVRATLMALLEFFDREPGLARVCLVETLKGDSRVLERRRRALDVLVVAVDEGRLEAKGSQPPPLAAESTVGGVLSVIHARLLERDQRPVVELTNSLMSMIVNPYLGSVASNRELERRVERPVATLAFPDGAPAADPFKDLPIRITFRTARVLNTIGELSGRGSYPSNREVAEVAGVADQGQMSKLLRRLEKARLIDNNGEGQSKGEPNAWQLTPRGHGVLHALSGQVTG